MIERISASPARSKASPTWARELGAFWAGSCAACTRRVLIEQLDDITRERPCAAPETFASIAMRMPAQPLDAAALGYRRPASAAAIRTW